MGVLATKVKRSMRFTSLWLLHPHPNESKVMRKNPCMLWLWAKIPTCSEHLENETSPAACLFTTEQKCGFWSLGMIQSHVKPQQRFSFNLSQLPLRNSASCASHNRINGITRARSSALSQKPKQKPTMSPFNLSFFEGPFPHGVVACWFELTGRKHKKLNDDCDMRNTTEPGSISCKDPAPGLYMLIITLQTLAGTRTSPPSDAGNLLKHLRRVWMVNKIWLSCNCFGYQNPSLTEVDVLNLWTAQIHVGPSTFQLSRVWRALQSPYPHLSHWQTCQQDLQPASKSMKLPMNIKAALIQIVSCSSKLFW